MRIFISAISFSEYVIQQANGLEMRGHQVLVFVPQKLIDATVSQDLPHLIRAGVQVYCYGGPGRWWRLNCRSYAGMLAHIQDFKPDIMHIHENGEIETLLIRLWFRNVPLAVTIHDVVPHVGADSRISWRRKAIKRWLRKEAIKIHVHGNSLQEELLHLDPALEEKSVVIPMGTMSLFQYWDDGSVVKEPNTCLFFGRMEKYRGLDNIVEIGRKLKNIIPDLKIIVAGRGSELEKYKHIMSDLGVFEVHDEFIPDRDIFKYFHRASLLLLPYKEASQSGIVHMGFAFGLPVVATKVGAIPEVIIDKVHGVIVDPHDIEGFSQAVEMILKKKEIYTSMCNASIEQGVHLGFDRLASRFEDLYAETINKAG